MLALIQEITQERSNKDESGKNVNVVATRYRLCKNIYSWRIRGKPRRVVRQEISIPASATVAVQKQKTKHVRAKTRLNSSRLNRGKRTVNVRKSMGGRVSYIFGRWDILQVFAKFPAQTISSTLFMSWLTSKFIQPPFSQATWSVTLSIQTSIYMFLIEGKKELKAL